MDLFISILNMSIASSVLFLLVLLLRRLLRGAGSMGFLYMLWLPLLFRMLVPYTLPSPASLFNLFGRQVATPGGMLLSVEYFDPYQPVLQNVGGGEDLLTKQLLTAVAGVWAIVALALVVWVLARYILFRKKLARSRGADLTGLGDLFDRAAGADARRWCIPPPSPRRWCSAFSIPRWSCPPGCRSSGRERSTSCFMN